MMLCSRNTTPILMKRLPLSHAPSASGPTTTQQCLETSSPTPLTS